MTGWIPVRLTRHSEPDSKLPAVFMGPGLAGDLGVAPGRTVIAAGGESVTGRLYVRDGIDGGVVRMTPALLSALRLPGGIGCGITVGLRGELRVGPVVGIIADMRKGPWPFGEQNGFLAELLSAAGNLGVFAYVASPGYALMRNMKGLVHSSKGWSTRVVPAPDACYDRCLALTHSQQSDLSKAKASLAARGVTIFNTPVGSKEKVHNELKDLEGLKGFIPETRVATRASVTSMLRRHRTVYVKPSWGTQGKSITKITRRGGTYVSSTIANGRLRVAKAGTAAGMASRMGLRASRRMLVQQGIDLLSVGNRIADIRVLVQKDGEGEWGVTGCAARLGQSGSPVSNLHQGGGVMSCHQLFKTAFKSADMASRVQDEVLDLSLEVARSLERFTSNLGELGIDIGVDKDGRPWFIEANPRPGRNVFKHLNVPGVRRRSVSRPMEYARYLAVMKHTRKEQQYVEGTHGQDREGIPS